MIEDSTMIDKIGQAQALAANGDQEGACVLYGALWTEAMQTENQYQACVVAHFLAHTYIDPEAQLTWHLRALYAADALGEECVRVFYPSLHANLGDVYLRLDDLMKAREHIDKACKTEHVLLNDGYGRMIRSLITRLTRTIDRDNARN